MGQEDWGDEGEEMMIYVIKGLAAFLISLGIMIGGQQVGLPLIACLGLSFGIALVIGIIPIS